MRIEGIHALSGISVFIIRNSNGMFDLYCYDSQGGAYLEGRYRSADMAKKAARDKYALSGKWRWDTRIKLWGVKE